MISASALRRLRALPLAASAVMQKVDWRGLGHAFLFFWYFTAVCHFLLLLSGATGFIPLRRGFVFSLLWLIPLLIHPIGARKIAAGIGVMLWAFSLVGLGYFAIYRQEFSQSVLFIIFDSNPAEASEYIDQYLVWWMLPALLIYSAGALWLWRRIRPIEMAPGSRRVAITLLVAMLLMSPASKWLGQENATLGYAVEQLADRMEPAVPWQLVIGYVKYRQQLSNMQALLESNQAIPPIGNLADARAGLPGTLVLVIGESNNRQHMSLYGYSRPTTPQLDALRTQLEVFTHVYASRPYTIEALQQALTFADQENPDLYLTRPSLMNIMKQAGYRTYWITNQQTLTKRNTMLTNFSKQMDEQVYLNHSRAQNSYQFDGSVLEPFGRILADGAERRFIVVHLLGTHMSYKYRYPDEFEVFKDRTGLPDWVNENHATLINEYDNAMRYNDQVLAGLIRQLDGAGGNTLLAYFSDHGEDVFDTPPHDFIGRNEARPTVPMYAIPFFLWTSESWKAHDPRRFDGKRNRSWQVSQLIHTWSDLAGLQFDGFDATRSLMSEDFKERPILIGDPANRQGLIDMHDLQTQTRPDRMGRSGKGTNRVQ